MPAEIRRLVDLDEVAVLLAHGAGEVAAVIPPGSSAELVSFDVRIADAAAADALLGAFGSGSLRGDIRAFAETQRRVRRLIKQARTPR